MGGILPLRLRDVGYSAGGHDLLDGLTFDLHGGDTTVILGSNGAGKSLLLRVCHGLLVPSRGEVRWAVPDSTARRRHTLVFQRPVLLRRSAVKNVEFALARHGISSRTERRERASAALKRVGLEELRDRDARLLSGGEQQRVALARAWALGPEVLFLDEPTAHLDPSAVVAIEGIIAGIRDAGTKVVWTTHDLGQARRLADEVLFLHRGRLRERQPVESFFSTPESDEARAFLDGRLSWTNE